MNGGDEDEDAKGGEAAAVVDLLRFLRCRRAEADGMVVDATSDDWGRDMANSENGAEGYARVEYG